MFGGWVSYYIPHISSPPHAHPSCMLEMLLAQGMGLWVCGGLEHVCSHTWQCRGVPPWHVPLLGTIPLGTHWDRADTAPAPGPTPPWTRQESRRCLEGSWSSANISISHALYKHNKAEKLSVSTLSHVTGCSASEPTLLSQQVGRRHHLLVMHLFLRSKRQWPAHRLKPVICLA